MFPLFRRRPKTDPTAELRRLHDAVTAAVDAGREDQVRELVAATAAVELLDRGNDLYPAGHRVSDFSAEETREDRARISVIYTTEDAQPEDPGVARAWRCARDEHGTWTVTDIARPASTANTGDRGANPEFALAAMGGIGGLNSDPEAHLARERRGKL